MLSLFSDLQRNKLAWLHDPAGGVGFYPVEADPAKVYDAAYFEKYIAYGGSEIERRLMSFRVDFVARHYCGTLVDIGIGSGAFIDARARFYPAFARTFGFDVNPVAVDWLIRRGLYRDPRAHGPVPAISLWDVLEHIADFRYLLSKVTQWAFISIPIFEDMQHVLRSKHFRPDEHFWYFTAGGLVKVMASLGFELVEQSDEETRIGRDDIGSFAFRRA